LDAFREEDVEFMRLWTIGPRGQCQGVGKGGRTASSGLFGEREELRRRGLVWRRRGSRRRGGLCPRLVLWVSYGGGGE
jgi:hypothetical protein